ncbi:MAG: HPr family phosphocarrier protein [Deltaproteobacteria bacterium]|nr:HPr family phosphocarrier protein [Deltaproteobacteria bacterium]
MPVSEGESRRTITIKNELGLHARAAAQLVQIANRYDCELYIRRDDLEVNGKSIMGVLMLAASPGTQIEVRAVGGDEATRRALLDDLAKMIENRFGEDR